MNELSFSSDKSRTGPFFSVSFREVVCLLEICFLLVAFELWFLFSGCTVRERLSCSIFFTDIFNNFCFLTVGIVEQCQIVILQSWTGQNNCIQLLDKFSVLDLIEVSLKCQKFELKELCRTLKFTVMRKETETVYSLGINSIWWRSTNNLGCYGPQKYNNCVRFKSLQ